RPLDRGAGGRRIADVRRDRERADAGRRGDVARRNLDVARRPREERDVDALLGEAPCYRLADALACAGDERDTPTGSEIHPHLASTNGPKGSNTALPPEPPVRGRFILRFPAR